MRLELAPRVAGDPHALFRALDAGFAVQAQLVLDVEAGMAERDDALNRYVIAEAGRSQESSPCAHEGKAAKCEISEHFEFGHSKPALEQQRGRSIEDFEVARIEDDSGGVAVAPFDPHRADIGGCCHLNLRQRGAMRSAPSRRITSPLR